jgi:hypothetical protein
MPINYKKILVIGRHHKKLLVDHLQVPLDSSTILSTKGIRPIRRTTNQFITILKKGLTIIARK